MRISTKGRYATRLMLDLAVHYECGFIPLKAVSQRQNISDKYLEQIITQLSRAGFVRSARGAQGGYRISSGPRRAAWPRSPVWKPAAAPVKWSGPV